MRKEKKAENSPQTERYEEKICTRQRSSVAVRGGSGSSSATNSTTEYVVHLRIYRACKSSFILSVLCGTRRNTNEALTRRTAYWQNGEEKRIYKNTCVSPVSRLRSTFTTATGMHCKCMFVLYNAMNFVDFNAVFALRGFSTLGPLSSPFFKCKKCEMRLVRAENSKFRDFKYSWKSN